MPRGTIHMHAAHTKASEVEIFKEKLTACFTTTVRLNKSNFNWIPGSEFDILSFYVIFSNLTITSKKSNVLPIFLTP
jgi:hypothetical protein